MRQSTIYNRNIFNTSYRLFLFLSICYLYNICYYSIFREKKFPYNFCKYTSVEYRFISRIVAFEVGKYLQLTSREEIAQLLTTRTRKRVPFPPSSLPSPSLSSASYKRRISRSAELRQKLARDKRVWREKRICHPLGAMLWCIVAKWMLNGLPALRDVKAFFSKIAAEICSAPRGLPRRPISDFHAWKGETARGGGQSEQFVSLNVNSRIYWWWERSQRRKLFYCTARHY